MNHYDETTHTPFAEVAASLGQWAGRTIVLWVAHEASGDGLVAELTRLKVERVEALDEFDHGLGDGVRATLSAGGEVVGELVVAEQLVVSAALDPRQVELRLGGVMVGIAEARMTSEAP